MRIAFHSRSGATCARLTREGGSKRAKISPGWIISAGRRRRSPGGGYSGHIHLAAWRHRRLAGGHRGVCGRPDGHSARGAVFGDDPRQQRRAWRVDGHVQRLRPRCHRAVDGVDIGCIGRRRPDTCRAVRLRRVDLHARKPAAAGGSLFLYIGEVGNNGEVAASTISVSSETVQTPEPLSAALLGAGLLGLGWVRRRG